MKIMKLMMQGAFALFIVPVNVLNASAGKEASAAAEQTAGVLSKKYPILSQHAVYQEWLRARTPKEKAAALKSYIPDYMYDPTFKNDTDIFGRIFCDSDICKNNKDRKAFFDEFEQFLKENEKILSEREYSLLFRALQKGKQEAIAAQERHAARHQMPADLEKALKDGNSKFVLDHLTKNPADTNAVDEEGNTPLIKALEQEKWNVPMIKELIKKTKDLNFKNDLEETALHKAASSDDPLAPEIIKLLVKAGAAPTVRDDSGNMPIVDAVRAGNLKNTKALLVYKTSLDKVMNPHHAIMIEAVRALPSGTKEEICPDCNKVHHEPTEQEQIELLTLLAKHGADMNPTDTYDRTPLTQAVYFNNEPIARFLLEHKAEVTPKMLRDAVYGYMHGAMIAGSKKQRLSIIKLLLERGASPEDVPPYDPLIMAVIWSGDVSLVKLLVEHGANLNARHGQTPLEYARSLLTFPRTSKEQAERIKDIIEYLVKVSPEYKESQGVKEHTEAAKELAQTQVPQDVSSLLSEFTAGPTHPSKVAMNEIKRVIRGDYHSDFDTMLSRDRTVLELADEAGDTPLLLAIKYEKPDAINTILAVLESLPEKEAAEMKAKVFGHKNEQGFNANELAKALGNKEIVDILAPYYKE